MSAVFEQAVRDAVGATAARTASAGCFHCGLPVPHDSAWQATIGGKVERMCCPGCAAAAQAIVDGGFADYYATRTAYAAQADIEAANAPELDLVDGGDADGAASGLLVLGFGLLGLARAAGGISMGWLDVLCLAGAAP